MKKILVTGATGFVGNYVVEELMQNGFEVIATSTNLDKALLHNWFNKVKYVEFNLKDFDTDINYFDFFHKPDLLIHLAWEGLPNYKDQFHVEENLPRHAYFLRNLILNGLKDLTITGTCLEYGMKEGCLEEDLECNPSNAYAFAKNELRVAIQSLQTEIPFQFKWVRLFYMYGKGQSSNSLISQLEYALDNNETMFNMSGGEQVRDFLPVEKVAEYIVAIATQNETEGIINCCSGSPVKLKDFVEKYVEVKNKNISLNLGYYPYTDYEPMKFWGDNSKLKLILSND